jgi:hypothetical protein
MTRQLTYNRKYQLQPQCPRCKKHRAPRSGGICKVCVKEQLSMIGLAPAAKKPPIAKSTTKPIKAVAFRLLLTAMI